MFYRTPKVKKSKNIEIQYERKRKALKKKRPHKRNISQITKYIFKIICTTFLNV